MKWRGHDLDFWFSKPEAQRGGSLTYNLKCEVCDLAFAMGLSEEQFYDKFSKSEREQLLATYISKRNRSNVMAMFPPKAK